MPVPVKVSDRLMQLAKADAATAHRSATAQIEHWATLGRAIEIIAAYREVLALKTIGRALPFPAFVQAEDVRGRGGAHARHLLAEQRLLDERGTAAAVLLRP